MRQSWLSKLSQGFLILCLVYFILLPIAGVLIYGFFDDQKALTLQDLAKVMGFLKNSMIVSVPATVLSVVFGIALSLTAYRLPTRSARYFRLIGLIPLIDPPFVGSIAFIMLFGRNGLITRYLLGLDSSPYGWHGIVLLQVLSLSSIAYLLISSAIRKIDLSLEDAARNLGLSELGIFFKVTLPMMIPEIANTALLIFLMSLADFTTPLIIGGAFQTLASSIYIQITGVYNMKIASLTGAALLLPCVAAFLVHRYRLSRAGYASDYNDSGQIHFRVVHPAVRVGLIALSSAISVMILTKNVFILIGAFTRHWGHDYAFSLDHFKVVLAKDFSPFINTIRLAVTVAVIASLLGILIAYLVRTQKTVLPKVVDFLALFPAAIPGILFGIGYLVVFRYPLFGVGRFIFEDAPRVILLGTKLIIYIICIARFINVGTRAGYATLEHLDPDLENAAFTLGASWYFTFTLVMMPALKDAFFSAFFKNLSTTMTTLGAIILLILPSNKVAIQLLFQTLVSSSIGGAAAMALLISLTNVTLLVLFHVLFYSKQYYEHIEGWFHERRSA
ncbi:ABC transporter permease [Acidaminobacter hydrogenoformans]|uniref:Iron(III) transport system permease protein n=1 Tax=Acidaminobacter hydrogenoformans DSM 2784 TaxID=1120920 RepID=A0A1G5RR17_9FIRM|nr:iron ABC transporter permease [Acidaminobacter hydrogenoformans]SCZ76447.1 iron(III) transport system permease protein [Acidaminobacter hydrogenoformans DSM 2784]